MRFPALRLVPCLALIALAACASTRIVDSWTAPGLTPASLNFEHVVAIAAVSDETTRRIAEETLARSVTRTRVTPAYELVGEADRVDGEHLRAALRKQGIDGAVMVRLVGVQDKQTYVPGTTHVIRGGYYGYYTTVIHDPGYYRNDTYVKIETSLHDVTAGKLLWSGVSESLNPANVRDAVEGVVSAARSELQKKGLLP
jgi:hypothetical protein